MKRVLSALLVLAAPVLCFASGITVPEQGSKGSAMGNAFVATADDPSALFYNPAGIAFLEGKKLSFNMSYIRTDIDYKSPTVGNHSQQARNFFIPAFYFTMPLSEKVFFGFSVTAPYNLATDWKDDFPGRFASRHAKIVTMDYHPAFAFKFDDRNALSIGLHFYDSNVNLIRAVDSTVLSSYVQDLAGNAPYTILPSEGTIDSQVSDSSWGFDLGYLYKGDPWSFGLTYRSKASFDYEGWSSFEVSPYVHNGNEAAFIGQEVGFELDSVPASIQAGLAYDTGTLRTEFDLQWTDWSAWDSTEVHFSRHTAGGVYVWAGTPVLYASVPVIEDEKMLFDWSDTMAYRLGFNYRLSDRTDIRWGLVYDEAPIPDETVSPVLPDQDRWMLTFGAGHKLGDWQIDWFAQYIQFDDGEISEDNIYRYNFNGLYMYPMTPDGQYEGKTYIFGVQVTYSF